MFESIGVRLKDEFRKVIGDIEAKIERVKKGSVSILMGTVESPIPGPVPQAVVRLNDSVAGSKTGTQTVTVPLLLTGGGGPETHSLVAPGTTVLILAQGDYKAAIAAVPDIAVGGPDVVSTAGAYYSIGIDCINRANFIQCLPGGILQINIPPTIITIDPTGVKITAPTVSINSASAVQVVAGGSVSLTAGSVALQASSWSGSLGSKTETVGNETKAVSGATTETLSNVISNAAMRQM